MRLRAPWLCGLLLACSTSSNDSASPGASAGAAATAGTAGVAGADQGMASLAGMTSVPGGGAGGGGAEAMAGASGSAAGLSSSAGAGGAAGSGGAGGGAGGSAGPELPKASGFLCVFDYDLTLSTNNCDGEEFACRTNTCITYNWYPQCMSTGARHAIATCVERGAFVGIASHATVDLCWDDKVAPIIEQAQFPELTSSGRYANPTSDFSYPAIDDRKNWNCDDCAYHMNGGLSKPELISRVMKHYGLDPASVTDRAKVIFWDDMLDNITKTNADMPEVHTVRVHQNTDGVPNSGGCGLLDSDIQKGWAPLGF